jgi:hypothetical protein
MSPERKRVCLDQIYGRITIGEGAAMLGISGSRMGQLVTQLLKEAQATRFKRPSQISAAVAQADPRNRVWAFTPEYLYYFERFEDDQNLRCGY